MNTNERRLAIRNYISEKRETSISELMQEFHASRSTVKRDLEEIAEIASFYGVPGKGGGIRAMDGWYVNKTYFTLKQEALVRNMGLGLQTEEEKRIFETILTTFVRPKSKAN